MWQAGALLLSLVLTPSTQPTTMRQAGALLLPSDEDGTALDNARRNKKGGVRARGIPRAPKYTTAIDNLYYQSGLPKTRNRGDY